MWRKGDYPVSISEVDLSRLCPRWKKKEKKKEILMTPRLLTLSSVVGRVAIYGNENTRGGSSPLGSVVTMCLMREPSEDLR